MTLRVERPLVLHYSTGVRVEPSQYQSLGQCGAAHLSSPSRTLINPVLGSSVVRYCQPACTVCTLRPGVTSRAGRWRWQR